MTDILTLTPSQMDRVMVCPPSSGGDGSGERIEEVSDRGRLGSAAHEALASLVVGEEQDRDWLIARAKADNLNPDELAILYYIGRRMWERVSHYFPTPSAEVPLAAAIKSGEIDMTGTSDVVSVTGALATIADWKTGRSSTPYTEQLRAYAWLVAEAFPEVENVSATVLWIREERAETNQYSRAELNEWRARVTETLTDPRRKNVYRPGTPQCDYCPKRIGCRAREAYTRESLVLFEQGESGIAAADDKLPELYARLQLVEKATKFAREEIIRRVTQAGGIVDEEGCELTMQERKRESLDTLKAWPVICEEFTAEEVAQFVTVSKAKALNVATDRVSRGEKKAVREALMAKLLNAGAVETQTTYALTLRRRPKEIGE